MIAEDFLETAACLIRPPDQAKQARSTSTEIDLCIMADAMSCLVLKQIVSLAESRAGFVRVFPDELAVQRHIKGRTATAISANMAIEQPTPAEMRMGGGFLYRADDDRACVLAIKGIAPVRGVLP